MPSALILLAAVMLTVLVVALVVPQWLSHLAASAISGSVPNCRLPVAVGSEVGFVDTHTGLYTKDVSASVAGLPYSFVSRPMFYSPALKRWLPVSVSYVSPDGRSYAWIRLLPDGSTQASFKTAELHRYEVATRTDQALWSTTVFFIVWRWDAAGILVSVPPSGSDRSPANWWLVDPVTGAATQQVSSSHASLYSFTPLAGDPTDISFSIVGVDAEGHTIWWLFTNGKGGGVNWVFYETAPGQRVFIYRGTKDDASALDPLAAMADSTGIWFSDYRDPNVIRHWQQGTGLRNVMVTGLPAVDQGSFPGAIPSSPCSPPAASPLPLPSPEVGGIFALIPPGDFDAAGLSSATALVTPFQLNAANGARKLTFIGAYADPARTVLLFRTDPDFQLHFSGGGGARTININIAPPDPTAKVRCLKPATCDTGAGLGPTPTDLPMAPESLTLDGFLNTTLTSGPNRCGIGGGSSGTMFTFGTYFQVDGTWYSLSLYSDPAVRQYRGPGTYTAIAWFYTPTQRLYSGTVQLTVTADHSPGPFRGSVQGTLDRVGTITQQPYLSVSGTWTCTPGGP